MALYEFTPNKIVAVAATTFWSQGVKERGDLQRLLRDNIAVVAPEVLIITEEFGDWQDSKRRIDLLGLDKYANLVVIELKRTDDGGHMELQALRYAAMISAMTFDQVVAAHEAYLLKRQIETDARTAILEFLDWTTPNLSEFAQNVRLVLVSEDFSKELTTTVIWLNQRDLDITCVRMTPYIFNDQLLIDAQQTIPLPEAADYQVQIKKKIQQEQVAKDNERDYTKFDVTIEGVEVLNLPKRKAILRIVKALCDRGVTPEQIAELPPSRLNRWRSVEGVVESEEFKEQLAKEATLYGNIFDEGRWFLENDELIHLNDKTYAFSNQWGAGTAEIMALLLSAFPSQQISFKVSD